MKNIFLLIICFTCFEAEAQDYQLFRNNDKKLFRSVANPSAFYSLSIDSVITTAADTLYYNYFNLNDSLVLSDSCPFWGPMDCSRQDAPSWLGSHVRLNNNIYTFFTKTGDSLVFDFTIPLSDTAVFYSDNASIFKIVNESNDTLHILGNTDSAKIFRIIHTNTAGNSINSPLNARHLIVSQSFGIVNFFRVDSFPLILDPVNIIGDHLSGSGLTALTSEGLYDYLPGDEIQKRISSYHSTGNPAYNFTSYTWYIILSKNTIGDTVFYQAARNFFYQDSSYTINDTVMLKYYLYDTLASVPFEKFDGNINSLYVDNYCGINLLTFSREPVQYTGYCASENCWGAIDTGGPMPFEKTTYVSGLGKYEDYSLLSQPPPVGYGYNEDIIYFKKYGITCNTPVIQHVSEPGSESLLIFPVPASTEIRCSLPYPDGMIYIYSVNGNIEHAIPVTKKEIAISVDKLSAGLYILNYIGKKGTTRQKFIIN